MLPHPMGSMDFCSIVEGWMSKIDRLKEAAQKSGLTMDFLEVLTQGLSRQAFRKVMDNASSIPSYMKSSDKPYVLRICRAAFKDRR